ncbi:MAG: DUF2284 domain-containing protein [Candidatus Hodarchaeota archaeon]
MVIREELEEIFFKNGCNDFKWINPDKIVVAQWVRMKCMYGCPEYGNNTTCPPSSPSVPECERFFQEYKEAVIFRFEKKVAKPEDRHEWIKQINTKLVKMEREVFLAGHQKVFLLFMGSCLLCEACAKEREACKHPKQARPTPESLAVDVFTTVRQIGYPIVVLKDYSETMNRYAFLMIE